MGKKRLVFLVSAALFLIALRLPFWVALMKAPSYPQGLQVRLYPYGLVGDIKEINTVGWMLGLTIPEVPKVAYLAFQVALVMLALICLLAVFARPFEKVAVAASWLVLIGLTGYAQYSLYVFGHNLPPDRPLQWFEPFTPPLVGVIVKQSIRTYHLFHAGGLAFFVATLLPTWVVWKEWRERRTRARKEVAGQNGQGGAVGEVASEE